MGPEQAKHVAENACVWSFGGAWGASYNPPRLRPVLRPLDHHGDVWRLGPPASGSTQHGGLDTFGEAGEAIHGNAGTRSGLAVRFVSPAFVFAVGVAFTPQSYACSLELENGTTWKNYLE